MKKLKKGAALYLHKGESAILLSGKLHMVCYDKDLHSPNVSRLYHSGDIIGLAQIDEGLSTRDHVWICALVDCDLFYVPSTYLHMLWQ